jgi:thiol-disulfide isomerase/thioredoxin
MWVCPFAEKVTPIIQNGKSAPVFMLPALSGSRISIRDFCGKLRNPWKNKKKHIVILSFMASYCVPCRHEIPQLEAFAKDAPDDVQVLFISVDTLGREVLEPFKKKMKMTQQILMDRYGNVMKKYGVKKLPSLFILDKNGKMRFQSLNGLPPDLDLKAALNEKVEAIRGSANSAMPVKAQNRIAVIPKKKRLAAITSLLSGKSTHEVVRETNLTPQELENIKLETLKIVKERWGLK